MTIPPGKQQMKTTVSNSFLPTAAGYFSFLLFNILGCGPTGPIVNEFNSESTNKPEDSFGMSDSSVTDVSNTANASNTTDTLNTTGDSIDSQKRIFITQNVFDPFEIQGLNGADTICQNIANDKNLEGSWKAILSDSNNSFKDRVKASNNHYTLIDNITVVANSFTDLIDGNIVASISITEDGTETNLNSKAVWTGTKYDGSLSQIPENEKGKLPTINCNDWTVGIDVDAECTAYYAGSYGLASEINYKWIEFGYICCDRAAHLYCIEE